jgi:hypothetical protein
MQRLLRSLKPKLDLDPPQQPLRRLCFHFIRHSLFEKTVLVAIMLNTLVMTLEHYGQTDMYGWACVMDGLH